MRTILDRLRDADVGRVLTLLVVLVFAVVFALVPTDTASEGYSRCRTAGRLQEATAIQTISICHPTAHCKPDRINLPLITYGKTGLTPESPRI
jgi:hypothetical protein